VHTATNVLDPRGTTIYKQYGFDKVFGQHAGQREVYESLQVGYLVKRVIEVTFPAITVLGFQFNYPRLRLDRVWKNIHNGRL
jgi:hypothetical protein